VDRVNARARGISSPRGGRTTPRRASNRGVPDSARAVPGASSEEAGEAPPRRRRASSLPFGGMLPFQGLPGSKGNDEEEEEAGAAMAHAQRKARGPGGRGRSGSRGRGSGGRGRGRGRGGRGGGRGRNDHPIGKPFGWHADYPDQGGNRGMLDRASSTYSSEGEAASNKPGWNEDFADPYGMPDYFAENRQGTIHVEDDVLTSAVLQTRQSDGRLPCPSCGRCFSETAARRHIDKCKVNRNKPKPPPHLRSREDRQRSRTTAAPASARLAPEAGEGFLRRAVPEAGPGGFRGFRSEGTGDSFQRPEVVEEGGSWGRSRQPQHGASSARTRAGTVAVRGAHGGGGGGGGGGGEAPYQPPGGFLSIEEQIAQMKNEQAMGMG
jgi:hypothetical protein